MSEFVLLAAVAAVGFASTSLDSLVVMIPLMGADPGRTTGIAAGYLGGAALIVVASVAVALAGESIPEGAVRWLGWIPISFGVLGLVRLGRRGGTAHSIAEIVRGPGAITLLTLSLSSDNFGVLIPLLAESPRRLDPAIVVGCALAALACALTAAVLARRATLQVAVERWGARVVPLVLIAIGLYVWLDTPTDRL